MALAAPDVQTVDGVFEGYADGEPRVTLNEVDSSLWEVTTADPSVIRLLRERYPDAVTTRGAAAR
ncbi:hypothetical protein [Nocardiopsis lucentensis]|uniref:hypothetical protein n=1 Tax=Nocardiopsis lucentensis TaxID=53441 RepID=UPI000349BB77|nr:hypothetical protein [Nocardiopsis lucentensis]